LTSSRLSISRSPHFVKVTAVNIVDNRYRKILHDDSPQGLRPQIVIGDNLNLPDATGDEGAGAADGAQVNGFILFHRLPHLPGTHPLADHPFQPLGHEPWGVGVHPVAGGRAGGSDDFPRPRRRRPHEIDGLPLQINGKRLRCIEGFDHPFMGRIPSDVHHPRQQQLVARMQRFDDIIGQRELYVSWNH